MPLQPSDQNIRLGWSRTLFIFLLWQFLGVLVFLCAPLAGLTLNVCNGHFYCIPPFTSEILHFYTLYIPTIPTIILLIMIFTQLIREKQGRLSIDELLYCEIAKILWVVPPYVILAIELYKYGRYDRPTFPPVHRSTGDFVLGIIEAVLFAPIPYIVALLMAIVYKQRMNWLLEFQNRAEAEYLA